MDLHWGPGITRVQGDSFFSRGEWELTSISIPTSSQHSTAHQRPTIKAQVTVRRRPLLYVVMLLLPTAVLMLLDLLCFLIPIYLKQRLSVMATIFTGHFLFLIAIFTLFPPFTTKLPLIEVYLFGSLGLLAFSAMETAVVFQIANGRAAWFSQNICPSLSQHRGRDHWGTLLTDQDTHQTADGDVEPYCSDVTEHLLTDLTRIRYDLRSIRQEQALLDSCRELGCSIDRAYLYLHCLLLMVGGAVLLAEWNKHNHA
ncbi:5-hydroxytryptamine receptor 3A-like [Engraulis encrasicolus]|uniref:5-hydroxytryptamine receptor 3A-like n=1 Tax=Engraulis encrasicolus TaxID=184585 RepID=UPI002FD19184